MNNIVENEDYDDDFVDVGDIVIRRDNSFMNNPRLKKPNVEIEYTSHQLSELRKCLDPIYFINNYCKIITLDHGMQLFKLYDFQKEKIQLMHNERKTIFMEGRQSGKCCVGDTNIKVKNKKTGEIKEMTMKEFHEMCA